MKARNLMLAMLICLFSIPGHGQVELKKHSPDLAGNRALIREWVYLNTISYVETKSGKKYFVLEDPALSTASAALVPDGITVNDMDIYAEYLYFCGTYTKDGNTEGIVGIFNIPNLYSWGQPYYILKLDWQNILPGTNIRMHKPLKVGCTLESSPYGIHIPVVGEIEVKDNAGNITLQTGVCSACINHYLTQWDYGYYCTPDPNIVFTDITRTKNHFVAVGRNAASNHTLVKIFDAAHPFTHHPTGSDIYEVADSITVGDVLVTPLLGDTFALVNYYQGYTTAGSTIKKFDVTTMNCTLSYKLQQSLSPVVSSSWNLREIQYDAINNQILVLQDMDYPIGSTIAPTVCEYDLATPSNPGMYTLQGYSAYGMGAWSTGGFHTVGDDSGMLTYMRKKGLTLSSCEQTVSHSHIHESITPNPIPVVDLDVYTPVLTDTLSVAPRITINLTTDCIMP